MLPGCEQILPLPLFTPSLTNFVIHPLYFLTAYKSCDVLPVLAGTSDSKNPDPYYWLISVFSPHPFVNRHTYTLVISPSFVKSHNTLSLWKMMQTLSSVFVTLSPFIWGNLSYSYLCMLQYLNYEVPVKSISNHNKASRDYPYTLFGKKLEHWRFDNLFV